MATHVPFRGQVYLVETNAGRKLWVVVSNNVRNRTLNDFVGVRLTTTPKPAIPSVVRLTDSDQPLVGWVVCDDLHLLYKNWVVGTGPVGALTRATMLRVDTGLKVALAL